MSKSPIEIKVLDSRFKDGSWPLPKYHSEEAAGMDILAALKNPIAIYPGETVMIPTGFAMNIDDNEMVAYLHPRSKKGHKGLVLGNLTGVLDSDYIGQVFVSAWNRNPIDSSLLGMFGARDFQKPIIVNPGDYIAQMVFLPVIRPKWALVDDFSRETERGDAGMKYADEEK